MDGELAGAEIDDADLAPQPRKPDQGSHFLDARGRIEQVALLDLRQVVRGEGVLHPPVVDDVAKLVDSNPDNRGAGGKLRVDLLQDRSDEIRLDRLARDDHEPLRTVVPQHANRMIERFAAVVPRE